jgi:bleomycin hydrolase
MKKIALLSVCFGLAAYGFGQDRKDNGLYTQKPENFFFEHIEAATDSFYATRKETAPKKHILMDFSKVDVPKSLKEFTIIPSEQPVSQGITGTCWCFSTSSFFESESRRITGKFASISPMFSVYWQYVEKAEEYVRTRGKSAFSEGSETNAVQKMLKEYGAVPVEDYSGLQSGQPYYDHTAMVGEMTNYLESVKKQNAWNREEVVSTIKSIMDHYMGTPPETIQYNGKTLTPPQYLSQVAKINPDDYVTFMSLESEPFWTKAEYKVHDNWWHSKNYCNVPLNDFMHALKEAVKAGYSIAIGGDVSESGINSGIGVMMIPSYDIPSSYINDDARLLRFENGATTDDHAMQIVGYAERKNGFWFLIKDSGSGGHNNKTAPGYWYVHEDYVKLKMMTATINKDAVQDLLAKMK